VKPSRLFWKFFVAFCMATACSFFVGVGLLRMTQSDPALDVVNAELAKVVTRLIETGGIESAEPLLAQQGSKTRALALYDSEGRFRLGARDVSLMPRSAVRVRSPSGETYQLAIASSKMSGATPFLIGGAVSIVFSALLAWYFSGPLANLKRGFRFIARGQLSTRVAPHVGTRRDEIADLAREFVGMAAQLEKLWLAQQRLLHDVSHELRSPLTRLQVAVGLLRQSPNERPEMLARVEREAGRLERLLGEVLTLARLKAGDTTGRVEKIDLMDLIAAIVDDAHFEAQAKRCRVRLEGAQAFVTQADGELLYRAYENVIRNAVKYSPPEADVVVRARATARDLVVEVIDEGPGVSEAERGEIFEAFRRLDENQSVEGFGLGLAIAREAVERHGGQIWADAGPNGFGLRVVIVVSLRGDDTDDRLARRLG